MTRPLSEFDLDALHDALVKLGEEWADKDAAANALEESYRTVKAEALLDADGNTVSEREAQMLIDGRVAEHRDKMIEAKRESNRAKVRYDIGRVRVELMRTLESTRRAEMAMR